MFETHIGAVLCTAVEMKILTRNAAIEQSWCIPRVSMLPFGDYQGMYCEAGLEIEVQKAHLLCDDVPRQAEKTSRSAQTSISGCAWCKKWIRGINM